MTFKHRVAVFWQWFAQSAARFHATIEDGRCGELQGEISDAVDRWLGGLAWVFGTGEQEGEHSFTLSPDGVLHRQFLTNYWLAHAPSLPGWRFYASRQPSKVTGDRIDIDGHEFRADAMWVSPSPDAEHEEIDILVWHPLFSKIDEHTRDTVTFLWLDEVLGELGTAMWIGAIEHSDSNLREAIPLPELADYVQREAAAREWKKFPPGEAYCSYKVSPPEKDYPRSDTVAGSTLDFTLIRDFLKAEGQLDEDPLVDTGADFVYVASATSQLPNGKEVATRGEFEDALVTSFEESLSGHVLGGALGTQFAYVDLLLFDGKNCIEEIRAIASRFHFLKGATLHHFVAGKAGFPMRL